MSDLWSRTKGETGKAYRAFCIYRDLGVEERSVSRVAEILEKPRGQIGKWSTTWHWTMRVNAYDDFVAEERRKRLQREREEMFEEITTVGRVSLAKALERIQKIDPEKLTVMEALRLIKLGVDFMLIGRGESTEKPEVVQCIYKMVYLKDEESSI